MLIYTAVFLGGMCALTWEVLWLHFASLAIGVSAQAAAIVLSAMMLGITVGSLIAEPILNNIRQKNPVCVLAALEILIGLLGLTISIGFRFIEQIDIFAYRSISGFAPLIQLTAIIVILGLPASLMGASVPVFARIAVQFNLTMAGLYATNVAGASMGIIVASFLFIPKLGINNTIHLTAVMNCLAAVFAFYAKPSQQSLKNENHAPPILDRERKYPLDRAAFVVFCTGFSTFALEVSWFRSLRASLQATTESFALMLFATLIALAIGGYLVPVLRKSGRLPLSLILALAGFLVLATTPIIEFFDIYIKSLLGTYGIFFFKRLFLILITIGPPMCALGIGLPWLLDQHNEKSNVSILYAINTLGSVTGSLVAAWILLPNFGFTKSAWLTGGILIITSLILAKKKETVIIFLLGFFGFFIASRYEASIGKQRVQGVFYDFRYTIIESRETPDATVSVIQTRDKSRHLYIDGFSASSDKKSSHYMEWMGRLPMILHPDANDALIICFGTGQTVNGVRNENPKRIDVVDVNLAVLDMAPHFKINENVLEDPRTHSFVMDGRAFLRRNTRTYDVITLEPMPPTFAGSNALYSREFYQLIKHRLNDKGVAAQWLPFHLVTPDQAAAIVATFIEIFPNSLLWVDPISKHGILLGIKNETDKAAPIIWYGLQKNIERNLSDDEIRQSLIFEMNVLTKFADQGKIITDDNQFLAYGYGRMMTMIDYDFQTHNIEVLKNISQKK